MDNPVFANEEDIPMVHQDEEDYGDYMTPDTSRVVEISFTVPGTIEAKSTVHLRQKLKRDKIVQAL